MERTILDQEMQPTKRLRRVTGMLVLALLLASVAAEAQVTVDTRTGVVTNTATGQYGVVDVRYQQIKATQVPLPKSELDPKTRLELIRLLQSEQGFAMRPFPRGHKGLTLEANGKLEPAGEKYLEMVIAEGTSAKPGDRLVLSDVRIDRNHIVLLLNGGPEGKHRFLRHIQLGGTGPMTPITQDAGEEPMGARLTLTFPDHVPELTGAQVKALLAPLISFDVKTPIQAFTDTLPDPLKKAILGHQALVGMSIEMLLYAKGQPNIKYHEMQGMMPIDEWVYGKAPHDVEFVKINGNRVIQVEIAKIGKKPEVFTTDVVDGLMRTDGTPLTPEVAVRVDKLGDVQRDPNKQIEAPPPTLGASDDSSARIDQKQGEMKPVIFPKQQPYPQPGANPDGVPSAPPPANPPTTPPADHED